MTHLDDCGTRDRVPGKCSCAAIRKRRNTVEWRAWMHGALCVLVQQRGASADRDDKVRALESAADAYCLGSTSPDGECDVCDAIDGRVRDEHSVVCDRCWGGA